MSNAQATLTTTETVQALYAAFLRADVETIQSFVTEDVSWDNTRVASKECPWNADFSGRSNLPGFFAAVGDNLDITTFDTHTFTASGSCVTVQLRLEATVRKNGRPFVNDSVHVWTFDDSGRIASYRHYNDTAMELAAWRD